MSSNHRSIKDGATTLPNANGDRDFELEFDAPGLATSTNAQARPFLSYTVDPVDESGVRLAIQLNDVKIVDQTFGSTVSRSFNEIFDHGILKEAGNELRVFVPDNEPGSASVSDLVVVYNQTG